MPTPYEPTHSPGDTRLRSRYIGIRVPPNAYPTVEVLEQTVIRTKDGVEKILEDLGAVTGIPTLDPAALAVQYPARDPATDQIIDGKFVSAGDAFACVYAVVRGWQLARDAVEAAEE